MSRKEKKIIIKARGDGKHQTNMILLVQQATAKEINEFLETYYDVAYAPILDEIILSIARKYGVDYD